MSEAREQSKDVEDLATVDIPLQDGKSQPEPESGLHLLWKSSQLHLRKWEKSDMISNEAWHHINAATSEILEACALASPTSSFTKGLYSDRQTILDARRIPVTFYESQIPGLIAAGSKSNLATHYEKTADLLLRDSHFFSGFYPRELDLSNSAVYYINQAVALEPKSSQTALRLQGKLGLEHCARFLIRKKKSDAFNAITALEKVLEKRPNDVEALVDMSEIFRTMFDCTGNLEIIEKSIQYAEQLFHYSVDHEDKEAFAKSLFCIALALQARTRFTGFASDLDICVEFMNTAWMHFDGVLLENARITLASILLDRFQATEVDSDLAQALDLAKSAVPHPGVKHEAQTVLGNIMTTRYLYRGSFEDLKAATDILFEALSGIGTHGPPDLLASIWMQLSRLIQESHKITNQAQRWTLAFSAAHRNKANIKIIMDEWECPFPMLRTWIRLAELRIRRSLVIPSTQDLTVAINLSERAIRAMPASCQLLGVAVATLMEALRGADKLDDRQITKLLKRIILEPASPVELSQKALLAHQIAHSRPWPFAQIDHFQSIGRQVPTSQVITSLPILNCLGNALSRVAYSSERLEDYDRAIDYLRRHDLACARSDWGKASMGDPYDLRILLFWKYYHYPEHRDAGQESLERLTASLENRGYRISDRLDMIRKASILQYRLGVGTTACEKTLRIGLNAFEEALMEGYTHRETVQIIRQLGPISEQLAADALQQGSEPQTAFVFLETAKSILWDKLLGEEASKFDLQSARPDLASEFRQLQLDKAKFRVPFQEYSLRNSYTLAVEYATLLRRIREDARLRDFGRPDQLTRELSDGTTSVPLICVCTDRHGGNSRAIIAHGGKFEAIELPLFHTQIAEKVLESYKLLQHAIATFTRDRSNPSQEATLLKLDQILNVVLAVLWVAIAKPVLDRLDYCGSSTHPTGLPRVNWISTGWLGLLPIHLAGFHVPVDSMSINNIDMPIASVFQSLEGFQSLTDAPQTVHDRAVSSYVPSIKALHFLRQRRDRLVEESTRKSATLVGMPTTPRRAPLEKASEEIDVVEASIKNAFHINRPQAILGDVLRDLRKCSIFHVAAHGESDIQDPFLSRILLEDWWLGDNKSLNVMKIMKTRLAACEFAYLSICDGVLISDDKLRDEALHLAGAFQMAGVPSVVATWWPLTDEVGLEASRYFYADLMNRCEPPDMSLVPWVLHDTMTFLRRMFKRPYLWGVFAHFGI